MAQSFSKQYKYKTDPKGNTLESRD